MDRFGEHRNFMAKSWEMRKYVNFPSKWNVTLLCALFERTNNFTVYKRDKYSKIIFLKKFFKINVKTSNQRKLRTKTSFLREKSIH